MCVLPVIEAPTAATRSYFTPGPRWVGPALSSLAGIMVSVNASHPPQPAQLLASLACRGVVLVWENATSLPRPRSQWAEAAKTTFPYAQNQNLRDSYKEQTGKTCHFFVVFVWLHMILCVICNASNTYGQCLITQCHWLWGIDTVHVCIQSRHYCTTVLTGRFRLMIIAHLRWYNALFQVILSVENHGRILYLLFHSEGVCYLKPPTIHEMTVIG